MAAKTILIVADSRADQQRLERIVADAGYRLKPSCGGPEALVKTLEQSPDIVLLDVTADHMNGFRVCRDLSTHCNVPVVVISDASISVDRLWAEQQGTSALVKKPYTADEVLEQLRRLG